MNFCKKTSIPILGLVENMHNISVPLSYAMDSTSTGVRLVDKLGVDKTNEYLQMYVYSVCSVYICGLYMYICIFSCHVGNRTTIYIYMYTNI